MATLTDPNLLIKTEDRWFNLPDSNTLCRAGGNGPNHPSQLYAIRKYMVDPLWSFLDYGSGSGTTYEALRDSHDKLMLVVNGHRYRGLDIIPKNTKWCKETFPDGDWKVNNTPHKIDEPDKSWDVVYSRHVVDHMRSFEEALDEHCRVAKKLVIIVLWVQPGDQEDHHIKHIIQDGKVYEDEYTNQFSKPLVMKALKEKGQEGWKLEEYTEGVGKEVKGFDVVIVLSHEK